MKILFTLIFLFLLNCWGKNVQESPPSFIEEINKKTLDYDTSQTIKVLFGTNRKVGEAPAFCSDKYFTIQYDVNTKYGTCDVNVPFLHDIGNLDYDLKKNNDQTYRFLAYESLRSHEFMDKISQDPYPEILFFVHGFNVKFEEAILRAAQIKYDLKFPGAIVVFTWPAGAEEGVLNNMLINQTYKQNQENAQKTIPILKAYLSSILGVGKKTHVIVHSMGHQIVLPVIRELYQERKQKLFGQIVLNAPDFESVKFAQMANDLKNAGDRLTVYCSPGDNALVASSRVNNSKRVGSCELIEGVDMINVNPIDAPFLGVAGLGHGYYSSRAVLTDLYQVLLGVETSRRLFIRKSTQGTENYVLRR